MTAPLGATPSDLARLGEADFNVVLYPEIALPAAQWLEKAHGQPFTRIVPLGVGATREFIAEVGASGGRRPGEGSGRGDLAPALVLALGRLNLSHGQAGLHFRRRDACRSRPRGSRRTNSASRSWVSGPIRREFAREVREAAKRYDVEALITDDYLEVEARVAELQPELVLGTQMERHIAKRLGIPCAVISAPVHVQDFPARYSPQMGFEGANVIFDAWIHPLMMGLEEHLLSMFREDFEFVDGAAPSHLGVGRRGAGGDCRRRARQPNADNARRDEILRVRGAEEAFAWTPDAEKELKKIPFFVRGKARRNTERFATERGVAKDHDRDALRCKSPFRALKRLRSGS